ncbi:PREDICTED: mammalian ependymin-related protein 1 [Nipponia nippon]|uniref:mammalian ependymin-related protein 1 n=1 Tax=Nipponia nippon TaxID=128390 RepID=UPI000510D89A|nr:PREDICTED: mammalian ependymin-related protein 1 [Nipponia nippon]
MPTRDQGALSHSSSHERRRPMGPSSTGGKCCTPVFEGLVEKTRLTQRQVIAVAWESPSMAQSEQLLSLPWPVIRFFEYILLYKDAVMFQIEQVTKLCSKIALTEPWDPYDIPANSTYEDQYYIGGPGDEIMVQEWSDRKPARKLESWVGVYTVKDCYPVQETYTKNYSVTTSTRFFDLQLGIADPSVFTPPSTCQTAQPRKMKDEC